jgi:hypothetical protein
MTKLPFILSTIALAVLAGCSTQPRVTPASAPAPVTAAPAPVAPAPAALRAGFGRIESIHALPAVAGTPASSPTRRMAMRMDDSTLQYFDTAAQGVAVGDRIEILANGTMRYPG